MFDTIIKNAKIFDGTGTPHFYGDVAVKDGRIAAIGRNLTGGAKVVDAAGLSLAPGFIDCHTHDDHHLNLEPSVYYKLEQGVTTVIAGCCGNTCAPISQDFKADCIRTFSHLASTDFDHDARPDFASYLNEMDGVNYGPNLFMQVGHSAMRAAVSGYADRPLTPAELEKMKEHTRNAMEAGALGVSFGLIYPPGSYATEEELTEICKVVAEYGGTFSVHLRNEDDHLLPALEEMLRVAKNSGCRGIMSHQKSEYKWNFGQTKKSLAMLQKAVDEGQDIFIDQYPYSACSTGLRSLIPGDIHALGTDAIVALFESDEGRAKIRASMEKYYGVEPGGRSRSLRGRDPGDPEPLPPGRRGQDAAGHRRRARHHAD
ncbi:amidohydrolase family protein [Ruminococcaceae bacterium OttesenSCG-928-D13]|nr:amidohydrolase family protein [Ruminococcaceae bacterium OttesenSCG-928-D13]